MKIAYIGTYPPRQCGIGTFTNNLYESMIIDNRFLGYIVAINDFEKEYTYPDEVEFTIRQEYQRDYLLAANYINHQSTDFCIIEHEFGIFGGEDGVYILPLIHKLEVPLIVTLHTILNKPSYTQRYVLKEICTQAQKVVVMSHKAVSFLKDIYDVPDEKIALIEHGVPDYHFIQSKIKKEFKLENKKIILTFGFLGHNKGIETAIESLPAVIRKHPNVLYIIIGKTHPNVLRTSGEEYQLSLAQLIKKLKLEKHVIMLNKFVSERELFKYLYGSDIYITPYLHEAQITSGTLSFAVGSGLAVISTPYWHAVELLANGRGRLFDFKDVNQLSEILIELLDNPEVMKQMRKKAYEYGRKITWPKIGNKYNNMLTYIQRNNGQFVKKKLIPYDLITIPEFSMNHVLRLTDNTGIIQHASYGIPNLKEGYCLDDNARALLMCLKVYKIKKIQTALDLCPVYLSFIHYLQNQDGTFKNFLGFDHRIHDNQISEDAFGRTIWALGYLLHNPPNDAFFQTGKSLFFKAIPAINKLNSIRGIANTIIGICYYLKSNAFDDLMMQHLKDLCYKLVEAFDKHSDENWNWFENELTYDNAILPYALLQAIEILNDSKIRLVAFSAMNFLIKITFKEEHLSIIGNDGWFRKGEIKAQFAQQPVDVCAMVLMFHQAYILTRDKKYLNNLYDSFLWFLGKNDLRITMYDYETNGCCDGLESYGINRNQGAESTLAYLISHLTVLQAHDEFYKLDEITHKSQSQITET